MNTPVTQDNKGTCVWAYFCFCLQCRIYSVSRGSIVETEFLGVALSEERKILKFSAY